MYSTYSISAKYYDRLYGTKGLDDLPFYLAQAQEQGGPVLELGAGTGRITLPLARAGRAVTALDLNACMLERLQSKLAMESAEVRGRVTTVEGDMRGFDLGRQFALILAPFRAFMHLLASEDQRACLNCVARHLAPQGRFVFDAFYPSFEAMAQRQLLKGAFMPDLEYTDPESGRTLRRYASIRTRYREQVNDVDFRYETFDANGRLRRVEQDRVHMRWQTRWEAQYLLELCGLRVIEAYGGFDRRAIEDNPSEMIFVCGRA
jgi:SAM-dependent methyltransferase